MKYSHRRSPTSWVELAVRGLTPKYAKLCHLDPAPLIVFDRKQAKEIGHKYYKRLRNHHNYLGVAYFKANMIWINPNLGAEEVRETLAHEFVHFRFKYLTHGAQFEKYVKRLLKGEDLGAYRPKRKVPPLESTLLTG